MDNSGGTVALFAGKDGGICDVGAVFCSLAFTKYGVEIAVKFSGGT